MFLVGLTGGVGTGKSTVGRMFQALGVPVIDADLMARRVVEPGRPAWRKIRAEFGPAVFKDGDESGQIDRDKLRRIIFEDEAQRLKLNRITHPEIQKEICWEAAKCALRGHQYVILDVPLLFETNAMVSYMHKIIVVTCEEDLQLQRLMEQRGLTERESKQMIAAQMSLDKKASMAQFVIENSGSLDDSKQTVAQIHEELSRSMFHWRIRLILGLAVGGVVGLAYVVVKKCLGSGGFRKEWEPITSRRYY